MAKRNKRLTIADSTQTLMPHHRAGQRLMVRLCHRPAHRTARVWRYLDFPKFVSMLEERALFFCRLSALGDPFEGLYAQANLTHRKGSALVAPGLAPERFLKDSFLRHLDRTVVVNCWHLAERESAAMWRIYGGSQPAVCVQSTYGRLRECLPDVDICRVRYIDYRVRPVPESHLILPLLHKRHSFEHERELRAFMLLSGRLYLGTREAEGGYWRIVDLELLMQRIYVAPQAPRWFSELVVKVLARYGFAVPVLHSALDDAPLG